IRYVWTLALPIIMFAVYVPIFCNLRYRRKAVLELHKDKGCEAKSTVETGKYERSMLIQAVFVSGVMEIEFFCFYFLSKLAVKLGNKEIEIPINIFINCYMIFVGAMLPTVNLIFVKQFRNNVKQAIVKLLSKIMVRKRMFTIVHTVPKRKVHPIAQVD
ncbi:hypothetical protein LOAG_14880, partial [Loa loa]